MEYFVKIFGQGDYLTSVQMVLRGILAFLIAFSLIRISGRRSFGLRTPLDNIITILLGAILSRAVVGASPFISVFFTCFVIVLLHRGFSFFVSRNKKASHFFEGRKILVFEQGKFIPDALKKALVCEEDVLQGVRKSALTDDLNKIDRIYMERNGEISAIKK